VPLAARLRRTSKNRIDKIRIVRLDERRILRRGGAMQALTEKRVSVGIVGCGSVGGFLAMSLARCGISKFLLVDKDCMAPENVARHLCGLVDAVKATPKVDAVARRLREHFPHIECNSVRGDVLRLLQTQDLRLDDYALLVVAAGSMATERRINYVVRKGRLNVPVVYLWIEPFGLGGHILYASPSGQGCYECCIDQDGLFSYSIARPGQRFHKRESGCQSTFLPYSSVEVEHFISVACRKIVELVESKADVSTLYTWLGDLRRFEKLGYRIADTYAADLPYRLTQGRTVQERTCGLCGEAS